MELLEINNIIIKHMELGKDEEQIEKEEETAKHWEFQNILQTKEIMVTKVIECKIGYTLIMKLLL